LDGNTDDSERSTKGALPAQLQAVVSSPAFLSAVNDPSVDNYIHYRDERFTSQDGIQLRYKNFNNTEGNSQVNDGSIYSSAATLYPDAEDLNRDNTMNESEEYFQYIVDIKPVNDPTMQIGVNYIVDKKTVTISGLPDGTSGPKPGTSSGYLLDLITGELEIYPTLNRSGLCVCF
jgi:cell surface protein SprA